VRRNIERISILLLIKAVSLISLMANPVVGGKPAILIRLKAIKGDMFHCLVSLRLTSKIIRVGVTRAKYDRR